MTHANRRIGDRVVSPIAAGSVKVSVIDADHDAGVRMLCTAFDAGITIVDSAAAYVPSSSEADAGHNERIVAAALEAWPGDRDAITVVTKGGHKRVADGRTRDDFIVCGTPAFIREQCEHSLRSLGRDTIDVYLLHWPDPATPIEQSMEGLVALQEAGLVRSVGLSNVTIDQLDAASKIGTVAVVQNHWAPGHTGSEPVLRRCEDLGSAFMAYSPLGGSFAAAGLAGRHPAFAAVAEEHGVSAQRVALAWVLAQSEQMIAIVGASRPESIRDSAAAMDLELSAGDLARLDAG